MGYTDYLSVYFGDHFYGIVPPKALISPPPFPLTMNFGRLFKSKPTPRIAKARPSTTLIFSTKPYYIVASVEVGNTTTKCILTATDMNTGKTYIVNKTVKMTRDVRAAQSREKRYLRPYHQRHSSHQRIHCRTGERHPH